MNLKDQLKTALPILALLVLPFLVYSGIFGHAFIYNWDDYPYVLENEAIRGFTLAHLRAAFTGYFVGNYAPLHIVSYMLDYTLWGLNPAGYLFGNVLLHGINGALFYLLCRGLIGSRAAAFVAAVIFICHPVQVESVAWIAQRKNLLAMCFFLLAFSRYIAWRESGRYGAYLLSLVCLALALLSKSVAVIFPFVIILYDLCFDAGEGRPVRLRDKLPYLAVTLVVAFLALESQQEQLGGGRRGYPGGTPLTALYSMLPVLAGYLRDCLFPRGLLPFYMVPIRHTPDLAVLGAGCLAFLLVLLGWALFRRDRRLFFFCALFFVGLVPVSQIVPLIPLKNDRYLYFPLLGFAGFGAALLARAWQAVSRGRLAVVVIAALLLGPLPFLAHRQAAVWQDDITLWGYTVRNDPDNQVGWLMLMKGYTHRGDGRAASGAYHRYVELKEKYGGPPRGWEGE
ncbi:MAG TPA: glycosyltransferase family 39 protein [Geobacteraceae bacterium]